MWLIHIEILKSQAKKINNPLILDPYAYAIIEDGKKLLLPADQHM